MKCFLQLVAVTATFSASVAIAETPKKVDARTIIEKWPAKPRIAALRMIDKYGAPREATSTKLVWKQTGPWKRIVISAEESPHYFPQMHTDFLTQVIDYRVPPEKIDEISRMNGSVVVDRTRGEMSVLCDKEEISFISLNLAHDLITGRRNVSSARDALEDAALEVSLGKKPVLAAGLHFAAPKGPAPDPDEVTLESARRPARNKTELEDEEVLGLLMTIEHAQLAAANAVLAKKEAGQQTKEYAEMMREHHADSLMENDDLSDAMDTDPRVSTKSIALEAAYDEALANVLSSGERFDERAMAMMIAGHRRALSAIELDMMPKAKSNKLKKGLGEMRTMLQALLSAAEKTGVATLEAKR
jgi:predicted outer membrane protein